MNVKPGAPVAVSTCSKETDVKLARTARTILSVTALAWAIPFAQAEDKVALLRKPELRSLA